MSESPTSSGLTTNVPPTVSVIACGGAGLNMLRRVLPDIKGRVSYKLLDTSIANLQPGEKAFIIGGGGSGLVQDQNADAANKAIAGISDEELGLSDINIVIFALSGGSGAVVGPKLIHDIAGRRKKLVIALVVSSTQSKKHTTNTMDTLRGLRKKCDDVGLYLPITIFDNNAGGRAAVDRAFTYKLARLVDLLTAPTIEIDKNDRVHWVDVPKTIGKQLTGLRLLRVETRTDKNTEIPNTEVWPDIKDHVYDSVLAIGSKSQVNNNLPRAQVVFEGEFTTIELVSICGTIGNPKGAFDNFLRDINNTLNGYNVSAESHDDPFG